MSVMKVVYPRIRNLREGRDWTQQKVADLLFINRRTYSTYETGTHNMTPEVLVKLSAIYEVSVDYLLGLTDNTEPYPRGKK